MTKIPKISLSLQKAHEGESVAIVDGRIIAFAANSFEAETKAVRKGYKAEDIMTTSIMGEKNYVL